MEDDMIEKFFTVEDPEGVEVNDGELDFAVAQAEAQEIGGTVTEHKILETEDAIVEDFDGAQTESAPDDDEMDD